MWTTAFQWPNAERAINLLGPHLLPLISRAEVLLRGARPIDPRRMPPEWRQYRRVDRYELVGIVDVLSHVELQEAGASNLFVDQVCNRVPSLPSKFEIIVDYKGMRRPALTSRRGRLGLPIYEWQLQNYAHLRERQRSGVPVVAGVLVFLNELLPSTGDLQAWRSETSSRKLRKVRKWSSKPARRRPSTPCLLEGARHCAPSFGEPWSTLYAARRRRRPDIRARKLPGVRCLLDDCRRFKGN